MWDFNKVKDGKPLENCRNYGIVIDPDFQHFNHIITRREIMSEYIGDLLCAGKVVEKDIEELFSYRLADKLTLVERQGSFRKAGRLDLLYRNRMGKLILYELKKGIARLPVLDQIKRYMKASLKKYKVTSSQIAGVILAKSLDPKLYHAISKEPNITAQTYFFTIGLKS